MTREGQNRKGKIKIEGRGDGMGGDGEKLGKRRGKWGKRRDGGKRT